MDARQLRNLTAVTCLLASTAAFTGCTTLQTPNLGWGKSSLIGKQAEVVKAGPNEATAVPAGKYVIELRASNGRSSSAEFSISGPLCANEALQASGGLKKFNRVTMELKRLLPSGDVHSMPIEYDRAIRRVPAECDYSILAGDRLVITEDTGNMFSDMGDHAGDLFMSKPKSGKTKNGTFRVAR